MIMVKEQECISFLKKIGFFVDYNNQPLYHGRTKTADELEWEVDRNFNNSANNTGNNNVNAVPVLSVSNKETASEFAKKRSEALNAENAEVVRIVSSKEDCLIFDDGRSSNLPRRFLLAFRHHQAKQKP